MIRMLRRITRSGLIGGLLATACMTSALADVDQSLAPIYIDSSQPDTFYLIGEINGRTAFNFKRAIDRYGTPSELVLQSGGGLVHEGLLLALEVKELGLRTVVRDYCMSACFYVFAAGDQREINGELGVHQISSSSGDLESGQVTIADMIDVLNQLEVDREILVLMLQTPPDQMHVFTQEEIARYRLADANGSAPRVPELNTANDSRHNLLAEAIGFVKAHNRLWSQGNTFALAELPNTYAERVNFYDNAWTRQQVLQDKVNFAKRWPVRDYNFRPELNASSCSTRSRCTVSGHVDWYAHSPERVATSRGTAEYEVELELSGGSFRIIRENGRVISRR